MQILVACEESQENLFGILNEKKQETEQENLFNLKGGNRKCLK